MRNEDVPVVVVGAGPAGLAAAIALARLGVETMLVERRAELSSLPRATAISLRSMELIRSWGVEDAVRAMRSTLTGCAGASRSSSYTASRTRRRVSWAACARSRCS